MSANSPRFAKTFLAVLLLLLGVSVGHAAEIDQAKRQGLVGERADGYVGLVDESASADVRRLVADINARRKAEYQRIAQENDLELEQVQALAGRKAIDKTQPGGWILVNGGWQQK
jgi:uncharacterized protein YdbL (DUF1318 family)